MMLQVCPVTLRSIPALMSPRRNPKPLTANKSGEYYVAAVPSPNSSNRRLASPASLGTLSPKPSTARTMVNDVGDGFGKRESSRSSPKSPLIVSSFSKSNHTSLPLPAPLLSPGFAQTTPKSESTSSLYRSPLISPENIQSVSIRDANREDLLKYTAKLTDVDLMGITDGNKLLNYALFAQKLLVRFGEMANAGGEEEGDGAATATAAAAEAVATEEKRKHIATRHSEAQTDEVLTDARRREEGRIKRDPENPKRWGGGVAGGQRGRNCRGASTTATEGRREGGGEEDEDEEEDLSVHPPSPPPGETRQDQEVPDTPKTRERKNQIKMFRQESMQWDSIAAAKRKGRGKSPQRGAEKGDGERERERKERRERRMEKKRGASKSTTSFALRTTTASDALTGLEHRRLVEACCMVQKHWRGVRSMRAWTEMLEKVAEQEIDLSGLDLG